jgi:hypothetical protein
LNIRPIIIYFHSSQCRLIPYLHQRPIFFKANSSIVAILELIRSAQCLIEVIRSSGKEMWCVDAYQIPYYSRGIEGEKRTRPRFADWLIIGIVDGVCRIVIKSIQQCTYFLFSLNLLLVCINYEQRTMQVCS